MFGRKRRKDLCNNFNDQILKHVLSLLLISFSKSLSVEPYRPLIFSLLSGIVASTPNRMIEDLKRPVSVNEGLLSRTKTSAGLSGLDIFEEIYATTNWFFQHIIPARVSICSFRWLRLLMAWGEHVGNQLELYSLVRYSVNWIGPHWHCYSSKIGP